MVFLEGRKQTYRAKAFAGWYCIVYVVHSHRPTDFNIILAAKLHHNLQGVCVLFDEIIDFVISKFRLLTGKGCAYLGAMQNMTKTIARVINNRVDLCVKESCCANL